MSGESADESRSTALCCVWEAKVRVLVVDDEPDIRRFMSHALVAQGMSVDTAADGASALQQLRRQTYDVMLLDVLMPGASGVELLPLIFKLCPGLQVMMISALNEPRTRVRCLELGAVDYLSKPFVLDELVARVRIHTRIGSGSSPAPVDQRRAERRVADRRGHNRRADRAGEQPPAEHARHFRAPGATLDVRNRQVNVGGQTIGLTERESLVLAYLIRRFGEVCTRQEILGEVWGAAGDQNGNLVDVYVGRLRAKLPTGTITTVRNVGYAFNAA